MSYEAALEAAGATVLAFSEFGSYQGDWFAKVVYHGETLYIHGSYGSCSGCDAFQAEFDWTDEECNEHKYDSGHPPCEACNEAKANYQIRLAEFGHYYLDNPDDKAALVRQFTEQSEWDSDAPEVLKWLEEN